MSAADNTERGSMTLRGYRDATGLGREAVARQLVPPISAKTLERYEAGERTAPNAVLAQLASIYGVSYWDLVSAHAEELS